MLSRKMKKWSHLFILLTMSLTLVSCGGDDSPGGPARQVFGNGFVGNDFIDTQIISQIQCSQAIGNGTRATIAFRDQNGFVSSIGATSIPQPLAGGQYPYQQVIPNNNYYFQQQQVAIGRTPQGDVIVAVFAQGYTDIVISMCQRYHITSNYLDTVQYSLAGIFSYQYLGSSCGYGALGTGLLGTEFIRLGFAQQFGFSAPQDLIPNRLSGVSCQNNLYGFN